MSILPECIAGIKKEYVGKDDKKQSYWIEILTSVKITYCLLSVLQKTLICLFKQFQTTMHSGKIDICHLFCYRENLLLSKFVTNVWYVKKPPANCDGNLHLPILHLPIVELHFKLQEKLHCDRTFILQCSRQPAPTIRWKVLFSLHFSN